MSTNIKKVEINILIINYYAMNVVASCECYPIKIYLKNRSRMTYIFSISCLIQYEEENVILAELKNKSLFPMDSISFLFSFYFVSEIAFEVLIIWKKIRVFK